MHIKLTKSPNPQKKFRVVFPSGRAVDFGATGYSDYTVHKNPLRMRAYVVRHGGVVPKRVREAPNPRVVHDEMLRVDKSVKETWTRAGVYTAGFWSRWLLWSQPTLSKAIKFVEKKFKLHIHR